VLVVRSPILLFKGGSDIPLQGHLALTGDPTEMRIMWVSGTGRSLPTLEFRKAEVTRVTNHK